MAERGGQPGNQNAARGSRWRRAIDRALERRSRAAQQEELDRLAEQFLAAIEAMGIQEKPSISGYVELADRLDGKASQQLIHSGDENAPLKIHWKPDA